MDTLKRTLMMMIWKIASRSAFKWDQMRSRLDDKQIGVGWTLWAISRWAYRRSGLAVAPIRPTVNSEEG